MTTRHFSYWLSTSQTTTYPQLDGDITADVAIVGGGLAGVSAAWELTQAGRSVVLLEAARIGEGVTGNTTAKVTALQSLTYSKLRSEQARGYAQAQLAGLARLRELADSLEIECELEERTAYTYVETGDETEKIDQEVSAAQSAGLAAEQTNESGLPFPIASAVMLTGQAQFHPLKYLLNLAAAAVRNGLRVYENTRVVDVDEGRLSTADGHTVTANDIVLAAHYPPFSKVMTARLTPHRELVIAAPIPSTMDPNGMYITTLPDGDIRSVRTSPLPNGERLLIVTGEKFRPGEGDIVKRYGRLVDWARERFGIRDTTYRWAAQDNFSTDHLPFTGKLPGGGNHIHVTTGYAGWGMTNAVAASLLLRDQLTGANALPWASLFTPTRLDPISEAGPLLSAAVNVGKHFVGDRMEAPKVDTLDGVAPGHAQVVKVGGEQVAAYRDENGVLHAVSAKCTHMGCLVGFNDAERTWECPCHGSRFDVDGSVLQGPATTALKEFKGD